MFAHVDHHTVAHGLATLRGATAARQHRYAGFAGDLDDVYDVLLVLRNDDPDRLYLIDRGIGAVAPAAEGIEQYLTGDFAAQPRRQRRITGGDAGGRRE